MVIFLINLKKRYLPMVFRRTMTLDTFAFDYMCHFLFKVLLYNLDSLINSKSLNHVTVSNQHFVEWVAV